MTPPIAQGARMSAGAVRIASAATASAPKVAAACAARAGSISLTRSSAPAARDTGDAVELFAQDNGAARCASDWGEPGLVLPRLQNQAVDAVFAQRALGLVWAGGAAGGNLWGQG